MYCKYIYHKLEYIVNIDSHLSIFIYYLFKYIDII